MTGYKTKADLIAGYKNKLELDGLQSDIAKIMAKDKLAYVPHLYRGGFVIRGFGFSVERIGTYISLEKAGNPEVV